VFCLFSFTDRLLLSAEHIARYVSQDDINQDDTYVAGTSYGSLRRLVKRLRGDGLFETVCLSSRFFSCLESGLFEKNVNKVEST